MAVSPWIVRVARYRGAVVRRLDDPGRVERVILLGGIANAIRVSLRRRRSLPVVESSGRSSADGRSTTTIRRNGNGSGNGGHVETFDRRPIRPCPDALGCLVWTADYE